MDIQRGENQTALLSCPRCGVSGTGCTCRNTDELLPFDPWIGKKINDQYQILELIARGGMGTVYRARHLLLNVERAIKVIRSDLHRDDVVYQRFRQEAQAVMGLSHPNIVSFREFGIVENTPYVVMDLIEGKALDQVFKEDGQLETKRALDVFSQIANALEHAHSKGIFHRDIKPSNIMLVKGEDGTEVAKVLDFGIAKIQSTDGQKLTSTGEVFGSPFYMSPEQGRGQTIDARSDIYSLGCVMYEAMAGHPPFEGNSALETIMKHMSTIPPRMFDIVPGADAKVLKPGAIAPKKSFAEDVVLRLRTKLFPNLGRDEISPVLQDFEAIVRRCLEKEVSDRYASMAALADDLKRLSYGERLLNLQRVMSTRRRLQMASHIYKYCLIAFAIGVPVFAVWQVFLNPNEMRVHLSSVMKYPDTADSVIQEMIMDIPKDSNYEWNYAYLLWNQAQILRMKSLIGDISVLRHAIFDYQTALIHLNKYKMAGGDGRMRRPVEADCYEGLCRAYLQGMKRGFKTAEKAKTNIENAVKERRDEIRYQGTSKDSSEDLAGALLLMAETDAILNTDPKKIDATLAEVEKELKPYGGHSYLMESCLTLQADSAVRQGKKSEAVAALAKALDIQMYMYGPRSPECNMLRVRMRAIKDAAKKNAVDIDAGKGAATGTGVTDEHPTDFTNAAGKDAAGKDAAGKDVASKDATGTDAAGNRAASKDAVKPSTR